ncbi:MAG: TonB family protein [Pseudomonadota bacterium]
MLDRFKKQIMFLHPEPALMEPCARELGEEFSVHMAASGTEALTTLGITPIDIIVSAHDLPGMSGQEALKEANKRSPDTLGILIASETMTDADCAALINIKYICDVLPAICGSEDIVASIRESLNPGVDGDATRQTGSFTATIAGDTNSQTGTYRNPVLSSSGTFTEVQEIPAIEPGAIDNAQVSQQSISQVEIVVLTNDSSFLKTIRAATGASHVVNHAPNLQEAIDIVRDSRSGVLITDAAVAVKDVETITTQLRKHMPSLVTIVAGRREDGEKMMGLISDGLVYRFLLKPISPGRSRLAIEASAKKHLTLISTDVPLSPVDVQQKMTETGIIKGVTFDSGLFRTTDVRESGIEAPTLDEDDMEPGLLGRLFGLPPLLLAALAIVIAGGIYFVTRSDSDSATPQVSLPATSQSEATDSANAPAEAKPQPVVDPIDEARAAIRRGDRASEAGRLASPADDNAVLHYTQAATLQPDDAVARARLDAVLQRTFTQIEANLLQDNLPAARDALAVLNRHVPGHERLAFLNRELNKETARRELAGIERAIGQRDIDTAAQRLQRLRESGTVDAALLQPLEARLTDLRVASAGTTNTVNDSNSSGADTAGSADTLNELLSLANQRIASGQLVTPAEDNARYYYQVVLEADPDNAIAQQGMTFVASMLLAEVRTDIARADALAARRTLAVAEASGANAEEVRLLRAQIGSMLNPTEQTSRPAQAQPIAQTAKTAQTDAVVEDTPATPAATTTSTSSNPSQARATQPVAEDSGAQSAASVPAAEPPSNEGDYRLVQMRRDAPRYPRIAERRGQEGWVDIEFIVRADGSTDEVVAANSEPGSVFDKAAIDAVSGWRFEPLPTDNPDAFTRSRVRLEFNLTE